MQTFLESASTKQEGENIKATEEICFLHELWQKIPIATGNLNIKKLFFILNIQQT